MSTKSRLGIDITATNRTAAAFASVQRSMSGIQSNLQSMKFLMAGFVSGNFLEGMVRSFVEVSKQTVPVKSALDTLAGSWTAFAVKVGEAGLNDALIGFANRMSGMMQGANSLAEAIGVLMGGAVNGMGRTFEVIGRAIGFAYDNLGFLIRAGGIFVALKLGEQAAWTGMTILRFAASMRIGAIAMGLFTVALNMGKKGLLALTAVGLAAALSMETVTDVIKGTMQNIESMMGPLYSTFLDGLKALGLDTSALNEELAGFVALGSGVQSTQTKLGKGASDASLGVAKLGDSFSRAVEPMGGFASQLQDIAGSFGQGMHSFFTSVVSGAASVQEAFGQMAQGIIQTFTDLAAKLAINAGVKLLMSMLNYGVSPSQQGGDIFSQLLKSFAGGFATGGQLGAGKWGIAGEAGPEIIHGPARITPMKRLAGMAPAAGRSGGSMIVNIANHVGAHVVTRQGPDGSLNIEIVKKHVKAELTRDIARGGNDISAALERGYGLRRSGR